MSNIRVLPENLANQIAAGEVVERPASVVKELVENSLDAGATRITVQLEGDGTRLIRIIDDGSGMDEDDLLLCLERHATSKIRAIEELQAIATLGFRGEALPSIASVSRLTITSRTSAAALGTRVETVFGRILKVHESGSARGTVIEVRDLFGNVPARKKFVRAARTELFHVEEVIRNYALGYPEVGLSLSVNGSVVIDLPAGEGALESRARRFFCPTPGEQLIEIGIRPGVAAAENPVRIHGYLVPPDTAAPSASRLRLFVNGRVVRDRMLSQAVNEGLQGFIMKGRRPSGVFFVTVPPETVDVNVHPTKQEVRFRRNSEVQSALAGAVRQAMASYQGLLKYQWFGKPAAEKSDRRAEEQVSADWDSRPFPLEKPETREPISLFGEGRKSGSSGLPGPFGAETPDSPVQDQRAAAGGEGSRSGRDISRPRRREEERVPPESFLNRQTRTECGPTREGAGPVRFIGQLLATYLLCENEEGLLAIDQHAAHERLLFEALRRQFSENAIPGQALLFPCLVEFSPETFQRLKGCQDQLTRLGISLQEFGGASFVIKAMPAIIKHFSAAEFLREIADHLDKGGAAAEIPAGVLDAIFSTMACKAAIKAGQKLEPREAEDLLRQMVGAEIFSHCPHGRPVAKKFSGYEIRRWFHR
jgi:DNA mismatch repair protein MutL